MVREEGRKRVGELAGARGGLVSGGSGDDSRTGGGKGRDGRTHRCRFDVGEEESWVGEGELESSRRFAFAGVGCESGITLGGVVQDEVAGSWGRGVSWMPPEEPWGLLILWDLGGGNGVRVMWMLAGALNVVSGTWEVEVWSELWEEDVGSRDVKDRRTWGGDSACSSWSAPSL